MIGVELSRLLRWHKHRLAGERTAVERRIGTTAFRDLRQCFEPHPQDRRLQRIQTRDRAPRRYRVAVGQAVVRKPADALGNSCVMRYQEAGITRGIQILERVRRETTDVSGRRHCSSHRAWNRSIGRRPR